MCLSFLGVLVKLYIMLKSFVWKFYFLQVLKVTYYYFEDTQMVNRKLTCYYEGVINNLVFDTLKEFNSKHQYLRVSSLAICFNDF